MFVVVFSPVLKAIVIVFLLFLKAIVVNALLIENFDCCQCLYARI